MGKKQVVIMPQTQEILSRLGERIKFARLRRKLPVSLIAERAGISRATLWQVENGSPSVAMGIYAAVLNGLGMASELNNVIKEDVLGKTLQDLGLPMRKRAPKQDK